MLCLINDSLQDERHVLCLIYGSVQDKRQGQVLCLIDGSVPRLGQVLYTVPHCKPGPDLNSHLTPEGRKRLN